MNAEKKIINVSKAIRFAPDSDDVCGIIRKTIDELIDNNIMGIRMRLFLKQLNEKLDKRLYKAKDFIEINNLKRAICMIEQFENAFGKYSCNYELN